MSVSPHIPEQQPAAAIITPIVTGVVTPAPAAPQYTNQGGMVAPVYGVRRPAMYHLMETEMMSISAFNSDTLTWWSLGSFFLTFCLSILLTGAFPGGSLSAFAAFMYYRVTWATAIVAAMCYGAGEVARRRRKTLIDQVKEETKAQP